MRFRLLTLLAVLPLTGQDAPKLTSHHEAMKAMEGTWDAVAKMQVAPGKPPMESKGVEVNTLILNGLWLQTEFKADLGGTPFQGRGLFGYDSLAKKHVGTWVDTMGDWPAITRGTCKNDCKEQTLTFQAYGKDGKPTTIKEVAIQQDADHRTLAMYHKGKDGKFVCTMEIAYTRRK